MIFEVSCEQRQPQKYLLVIFITNHIVKRKFMAQPNDSKIKYNENLLAILDCRKKTISLG